MATFTFDETGLAQPSSATTVSIVSSADKVIAITHTGGNTGLEVKLESTNGTGTWINNKGEEMNEEFAFDAWSRMPQDAAYLLVETSSGSHNVNVPTDGGFRTTHRTASANDANVYIRQVNTNAVDA